MTGCRHPVSGKLNALDIANLRRGTKNTAPRPDFGEAAKVQQRHRRAPLIDTFRRSSVEAGGSDRQSATGTPPRPTDWSRATIPVTLRSPIVTSEGFSATVGRCRTRFHRVGNRDIRAVQRTPSPSAAVHVSFSAFCPAGHPAAGRSADCRNGYHATRDAVLR